MSYFWRICLFRAGPEEIPNNIAISGFICGLYLIASSLTILIAKPSLSIALALLAALSTLIIMAAALNLLLKFKQHPERFLPGFTALIGCNVMMLLIGVPLSLVENQLDEGLTLDLVDLALILFTFWWIAISGFILSRTANLELSLAIALAYVLEILQVLTINEFFNTAISNGT